MSCSQISVILSVYNAEKYLEESIQSIIKQTFKDWELIIINDGSTDNSFNIINKYVSDKIKCINLKKNIGIARARHKGIEIAEGEYLAIHDADDISSLDRLETQYEYLTKNLDIFCLGSHAYKIDINTNIIGEMDYPSIFHNDIVSDFIYCKNPIIDPTTMFIKKDYFRIGGYSFDKDVYLIPDMDLWLRALERDYLFHNLDSKLVYYRDNPDGMTQKYKKNMIKAHMKKYKSINLDKISRKIVI